MTASLSFPSPAILSPLRDYAVAKGLDAGTIARLWDQHCERSAKMGYEAGGTPWRRLVDGGGEHPDQVGVRHLRASAPRLKHTRRAS